MSTPNGFVYFFACREWFYNRIMPIFVNFARRIEIAGSSFERDMQKPSSFYSKFGVAGGEKSALGLMIEPRLSGHPTGQKTSRSKLPKIRRSKRNTRLQTTKKIRDLKSITFKRKTIAGKGLTINRWRRLPRNSPSFFFYSYKIEMVRVHTHSKLNQRYRKETLLQTTLYTVSSFFISKASILRKLDLRYLV